MKPIERFPPNDPREWLNRARSDLELAKNSKLSGLRIGPIVTLVKQR